MDIMKFIIILVLLSCFIVLITYSENFQNCSSIFNKLNDMNSFKANMVSNNLINRQNVNILRLNERLI